MEIYTNERPLALPAAVAPLSAVRVVPAARPSAPQAHQVQVQAELNLTVAPLTGAEGTSGFTGMDIEGAKQGTDVRGVPPRGRPV
ncbi:MULTISPECIES: hypothetical protein [Micromonospora]|uniref:Uncharacterized protein n=1 Tax=Micromonospora carbonacea TaxID=47853 RepID=A0A7H8XRA9_9ACTN|nr:MULTISPECIES: hypothetical protein [Micromonospora]MBB5824478.1 hypothetical protein [Micromonospora carbonacea]MDG4815286.1 hypothetical protein [Micromonospora sp. WMMD956]QLD27325.1 hypothetical protein HXZ27_26535 [Micromonospora carbonacea]